MAHYDIDTTCERCEKFMSIHPCSTDRSRLCGDCKEILAAEVREQLERDQRRQTQEPK